MNKRIFTEHQALWSVLMLCLIMLAVLWARIYHVSGYPFHEDEILSIRVMEAIVETGFPKLGENIYWRAPLAHYLMALPLFFYEVSPLTTRLVCIIFSVLLLPCIYRCGVQLQGRTAGFLAVITLGFLTYENLFASFARFYLPQQFFFFLAALLAYEYFFQETKVSGWWLWGSVAGTLATHKLGLLIWPVLLIAFLIGRRWGLLRKPVFVIAVFILILETYFLSFWIPESAVKNPFAISLMFGGLDDKLEFAVLLRNLIPGCWALLTLAFLPLIVDKQRRKAWGYYASVFVLALMAISLTAPADNPRYMIQAFPYAVLLAVSALIWLIEYIWKVIIQKNYTQSKKAKILMPVVLFTSFVVGLKADQLNVRNAFGYHFHFADQKPAHDYLAKHMADGDLLVSADPSLAAFFLSRSADYFLRERYNQQDGTYSPFPNEVKGERPEYFIDSSKRLMDVLQNAQGKRVWLYANWKLEWAIGPELDELVRQSFRLVFQHGETWVLVYNPWFDDQ